MALAHGRIHTYEGQWQSHCSGSSPTATDQCHSALPSHGSSSPSCTSTNDAREVLLCDLRVVLAHELHEVAVHAEDDEHLELGVAQERIALPRLPLSAVDTNLAPAFGALCAARGPGDLPAGLWALVRRP